jgi:hypothetical protein
MHKNKLAIFVLSLGMIGGVLYAQSADSTKPTSATKTLPTSSKTPAPKPAVVAPPVVVPVAASVTPATPVVLKPATLTELEQTKLENAILKYSLLKGQADSAQKAVTDQQGTAQTYIQSLEQKYSATYNNQTGQFMINPVTPTAPTPAKK